jgi:hypothetical protein
MRLLTLSVCLTVLSMAAFGQSDRGTITGTISDPGGAIVPGAPIQATNVQTGAVYKAASSATGNYTLPELPTGTYELALTVTGFKNFRRTNILVPAGQTVRIDVNLEVGSVSESVIVSDAAPLLKTESGELSHNVSVQTMDALPVFSTGASASVSGIRNPYAAVELLPGASSFATGEGASGVRLNGNPANTQSMRIEGQDATNNWYYYQSMTQPSVEAIQEFSIQTSNYAAEFGRVGGGLFNATMKSGTNQYHGSGYDYFANEALNAGTPFTNNGDGQLLRPLNRRNDWGATLSGPVNLPKLYNGHDKLFFFFNFEQFIQTTVTNNVSTTVPTSLMRAGNFQQTLTNRNLGTDPLGRAIFQNTIYDPASTFTMNGLQERNPFPNNAIPANELDPVALNIQSLIPQPTSSALINNYLPTYRNPRDTFIPSLKMDYELNPKSKLSGYWSRTGTYSPNNGIMPGLLAAAGPNHTVANTVRVNFDQTLTPTLLLHAGAGLVDTHANVDPIAVNQAQQLGLTGAYSSYFPELTGLSGAQGGLASTVGPVQAYHLVIYKTTGNTSLIWVHNNHTYKFGGEVITDGDKMQNRTYTNGVLNFSPNETGLPSLNGVSLPATVGYAYASFLLGGVDSGTIGVPAETRMGSHSLSGFAQDSWKVTRKLTLDYGLRYDFQTYLKDGKGYLGIFSPSTPNPAAGGRLGAEIFEGYGGGRCNCEFSKNYPFAFGPRLGVAYQFAPKTVLRAGAGVSYYITSSNDVSFSAGSVVPFQTPSYGNPIFSLRNGLPFNITFPNFYAGAYPLPGTVSSLPEEQDKNAGRPARQIQWSVGVQREIISNLLLDVTYVGNRGAWWQSAVLISSNAIMPASLLQDGLNVNSAASRSILAAPLTSSLASAAGFGAPYAGFPLTATVAQSLRPYPQFGDLTNWHGAPLGDTWYNSLQTKLTKRLTHGLDVSASFVWSKQIESGTESDQGRGAGVFVNDVFNRPVQKDLSAFDQPLALVFSGSYTTPKLSGGNKFTSNKAVSWVARDWQIGTYLRYASGLPILAPGATTSLSTYLYQNTDMDRVPGVPLFTQNLNCHCFDPNTTFVLNPAAWVNPPVGQFGTAAAYYSDYRYQRRPQENLSLGRRFPIKERASLEVRAEFTNIFNRTQENDPTSTNALATQTRSATGQTTAGFGYINTGTTFAQPRAGQIVARFQF